MSMALHSTPIIIFAILLQFCAGHLNKNFLMFSSEEKKKKEDDKKKKEEEKQKIDEDKVGGV